MPVNIKLVETKAEMEAAMAVRVRVFVHEQGISHREERDQADLKALHVLAILAGAPIGTGRVLCLSSGEAQIGRMAIDQPYRRTGIGSRILARLEKEARSRGLSTCILHAQTYIKVFYAAYGYREEGEVFTEASIEHILMRKPL